jgi:Reverse transcriptase (RNA-dependent DNA polymerase)
MFLTEKRDKSIKGRRVANGKPSSKWLNREDSTSPTASLESILLTAVVDAKEGRDVMSGDVPNAFIQTKMPPTVDGEARVMLKIKGVLVNMLVQLAPEIYGPYVVYENGGKVLYCEVLQALYGMLIAALLWYKHLRGDLEKIGFKFNPYDPCVANRIVSHLQHTVRFHVDDLMSSHLNVPVNDRFQEWLNKMYGKHGAVKCTRGPVHDYLGMTFDFSNNGKVIIDMTDYVAAMLEDCQMALGPNDTSPTPASDDLLDLGTSEQLPKHQAELFHTMVAKGLFLCKRARPDIHPTIAVLCTRVLSPNQDDWKKLVRLMRYLNGTRGDTLTLAADNLHVIKWHVDASFAVHPDFRSHTGGVMTYGRGAIQSISRKQKLNTRSSTEAELVGADDAATMILWTKLFMEAQGYLVERNILYQDNQSAILLETNGKKSSSKRTRALNIRYYFIADQVAKGNMEIEFLSTKKMWADFMSKPLQGKLFRQFCDNVMGRTID